MPVEKPVRITDEGKLITAWRMTDAERADLFMANELYGASPEGKAQLQAVLEKFGTPGTITIKGEWD